MSNFTLIVTVGPTLLTKEKLTNIDKMGPCIYRINGAHADSKNAKDIISAIRSFLPHANIMIDLPGNKVRTANLSEPIRLKAGEVFALHKFNLNFQDFHRFLSPGNVILANDAIYTLIVEKIENEVIYLKSLSDGILQTNKGLHSVGVNEKLPFLFERDLNLIYTAVEEKISHLSLSFVRNVSDIKEAKHILTEKGAQGLNLIAKVETKSAVENLGSILFEVDTINVDRGDLSSDVGMLKLPRIQDQIVEAALRARKNVFLATQFLKSMEKNPIPYIAELVDLHKTIKAGISGIQLSEETAVGEYPEKCVELVFECLKNSYNI